MVWVWVAFWFGVGVGVWLGFGVGFGLEHYTLPFPTEGEAVCIYRANEALECPPECFQLGGPPERSEGGEEAGMAGPLRADAKSSLVL